MLKIRFQRTGRKNDPSFRIVVGEHTGHPKKSGQIATVGSHHPKTKVTTLDADAIKYWLGKGAQASGTVHNLLITKGIIEGKKVNVLPSKVPPKPEAAKADVPTEASGPEPTETPVEPAPETATEETPVT